MIPVGTGLPYANYKNNSVKLSQRHIKVNEYLFPKENHLRSQKSGYAKIEVNLVIIRLIAYPNNDLEWQKIR